MKKRKTMLKLTAALLSLLILLTVMPMSTFAADTLALTASKVTADEVAVGTAPVYDLNGGDYAVSIPDATQVIDSSAIADSDNRVRSEEGDSLNTTVVDNLDGTHTMTLYDYPVKFVNSAGEIEDISLEITPADGGAYKTKASNIQTVFPKRISEGIRLSGNGVNINLKPVMPVASSRNASAYGLSLPTVTDSNVTKLDNETVSYYYNNNTTFEYSLTYTGFKEDIVVSEYTGQTEYVFTLETGGLTLTEIDGSYFLTDGNGEIKATVGDIIIFTADERNNTMGTMTHVTVKEHEQYMITIHVDADYLKDENTVYPIRIDPTIEITYDSDGSSAIQDVTINSTAGSSGTSGSLYVGKRQNEGISRILMRFNYNFGYMFNNNPLLIHRAYVELRDLMCETEKMTVETNLYNGPDWDDSTAIWTNTNGGSCTHYMSGTSVSYASGNTKNPVHRYQISILDAVKYWVSGEHSADKGIVIKATSAVEGGGTYIHKTFASFNRTEYKPSLTIIYYDNHEQYADPVGYLDKVDNKNIRGWAWCVDRPNDAVTVKLYLENQTTGQSFAPVTVMADISRPDVIAAGYGTGNYGFKYDINWYNYPAGRYKVTAKAVSMNGTGSEFNLYTNPKYYDNIGVRLNQNNLTLEIGDTATLTATSYIENQTDWPVVWISSDESVAAVDSSGKVTAVAYGTAIITVQYTRDYSASCIVTIKQKAFNSSYTASLKSDITNILGEDKKNVICHYTPRECIDIILDNDSYITEYCNKFGVPKELVQTILLRELWCVNESDDAVDIIVNSYFIEMRAFTDGLIPSAPVAVKTDSSTGIGQMYGWVAINAHNLAVDNGLISERKYLANYWGDIDLFWNKIRDDNEFAVKMVALEMYHCALDSGLSYDFFRFTDDEIKSTLSRYNGTGDKAVEYGNECFEYYLVFKKYSNK